MLIAVAKFGFPESYVEFCTPRTDRKQVQKHTSTKRGQDHRGRHCNTCVHLCNDEVTCRLFGTVPFSEARRGHPSCFCRYSYHRRVFIHMRSDSAVNALSSGAQSMATFDPVSSYSCQLPSVCVQNCETITLKVESIP